MHCWLIPVSDSSVFVTFDLAIAHLCSVDHGCVGKSALSLVNPFGFLSCCGEWLVPPFALSNLWGQTGDRSPKVVPIFFLFLIPNTEPQAELATLNLQQNEDDDDDHSNSASEAE
eukprot:EG_transcript_51146